MPTPVATPFEEEIAGRKSRAKNRPEFTGGKPKLPKHLTAEGKIEWRRCVKLMQARKSITPGDYALLALYATIFSRWLTALAAMGTDLEIEYFVLSSTGQPITKKKINPLLSVCQKCEVEIKSLAEKLGLTPVNRARVEPTSRQATDAPAPGSAAALYPHLFK